MPSIVIKSEAFRVAGIVLQSQAANEDLNGLVTVVVSYITTPSKRDSVSRLFYTDSQPPIFPTCINRDELQGRNLFLVDRSIMQENGIVKIDAKYVGALNRALTKPSILFGREVKPLSFGVLYSVTIGSPDANGVRQGYPHYDRYDATVTTGIKQYSLAIIGDSEFKVDTPSFSELFLGCIFTKKILTWVPPRYPAYDRNASATDIVFKNTTSTVGTDVQYNFFTPTVKVQTRRFFLNIQGNDLA